MRLITGEALPKFIGPVSAAALRSLQNPKSEGCGISVRSAKSGLILWKGRFPSYRSAEGFLRRIQDGDVSEADRWLSTPHWPKWIEEVPDLVYEFALTLDGHATGQFNSTSGTVTLTTTNPNDIILVCVSTVHGSLETVSTISDTAGLTWAKRKQFSFGATVCNIEIWWALAPAALSADVITVTIAGAAATALSAFGISGANTAAPWDINGSIPATGSGTTGAPTVTGISTTAQATMLIGAVSEFNVTNTAGSGFTLIDTLNNGGGAISTEYQVVSVVQSSVSAAFGSTSAIYAMIADAIQAKAIMLPPPRRTFFRR